MCRRDDTAGGRPRLDRSSSLAPGPFDVDGLHARRAYRYPLSVERITVSLDKDWLSVADICEYMGVSTFVVTRVLRSGELPAVKMGREWRVSKTDFEDWLNAQRLASKISGRESRSSL